MIKSGDVRDLFARELKAFLDRTFVRLNDPSAPTRTWEQDADIFIAGLSAAGKKVVDKDLVCLDFELAHHAAQAITDLVECMDRAAGGQHPGDSALMTISSFQATRDAIWDAAAAVERGDAS